ncbi:MAG: M20/M25/M40 family metallo-hydrolase, partial [Firmicutes bacterium]|nr:M20/M25/M40 family metallo-hydrolase [Bacillota bacterium]
MKYNNELYVEHLQGMVQCPTVSNVDPEKIPVEEFFKLHGYLEKAYPLVHKNLEKEVIGKAALVFHWKGTGKSGKLPVLLCAHQDVVPEGDWNAWKFPPFSGHVDEEGIMWGRGTTDCKCTMQAELDAVEALLAEGYTPDMDVYMAFGYNEEIMGGPGAACQYVHDAFAERGIRFGLVLDEGGGV